MQRRAVIHIGIDKTGTTTLQESLFAHRQTLLAHGILYPSLGANHSIHLSTLFRGQPPKTLQLIEPGATTPEGIEAAKEKFRTRLSEEFGQNWHTLVLSAESLSHVRPPTIARMQNFLAPHVADFRIVAYVRDPFAWIHSAAQERLKAGETLADLRRRPWLPNWRERLNPWLEAFGRERFVLVVFEEAVCAGLMNSFAAASDIPEIAGIDAAPAKNTSLSAQAAWLLNRINRRGTAHRRIRSALMRVPGRPFRLPADMAEIAREPALADIEWLNQAFSLDLYRAAENRT